MPEISQEQLDAFNAAQEKLTAAEAKAAKIEKDLEDARMEVLTPEYSAFLEEREKIAKGGGKAKEEDKDKGKLTDFEKVKQAAKEEALAELRKEREAEQTKAQKERDLETKQVIADFAKTHDDYEQFRPVMYGLSLEKANKNLSIDQLYEKAKKHVVTLSGPSEEQKKKQEKMRTEKPANDAQAFKRLKETSNEAIAQEALAEVKSQYGPIPQG